MRRILAVLVTIVVTTSSLPSLATAQIVIERVEDRDARMRAEIKFGFCGTWSNNPDLASGIVELPSAAFAPRGLFHDRFRDFARGHVDCWTARTFSEAEAILKNRLKDESMVATNWTGQWRVASSDRPSTSSQQQAGRRPQSEQERATAKAQADAEWNRKVAEHRAALARYNAQVAAVEAEKTRQAAQLGRAAEAAQTTLREHEAQLARNRAQQEEYQRQLRDHAARIDAMYPNSPCARYRRVNGEGWTVNPCV